MILMSESTKTPASDAISKAHAAIQDLLDQGEKPTLRAVRNTASVATAAAAQALKEWKEAEGVPVEAETIPDILNVRFLAIWNEARKEAAQTHQAALKEFQLERAELHEEIDALTEELSNTKTQVNDTQAKAEDANKQLAFANTEIEELQAKITVQKAKSDQLRLENAKLSATITVLEAQTAALMAKMTANPII